MEIVKSGKSGEEIRGGFRLRDLLGKEIKCPVCECVFKPTNFSDLENVTFVPKVKADYSASYRDGLVEISDFKIFAFAASDECTVSWLCPNVECRRVIFVDLQREDRDV